MKKTFVLTIFITICYSASFSQLCLPNGTTFASQSEIDSFQVLYPNCTKIGGAVFINDNGSGNITNLLGLNGLTRIGSQLAIMNNDNLSSLEGLENLDSISLNLIIENNKSLTSLINLASLNYVRGAIIIKDNTSLLNLAGLENFDTVGLFNIVGNSSLEHLSNLSNLRRVKSEFMIENNQSLIDLSGLENVTFVGEDLKIFDNDLLTDLQGLNSLEHVTSVLKIRYNDQLTSLTGLESLDSINGGLSIWDNKVLSSLESISNCYINFSLSIYDNPLLEVCNTKSICEFLSNDPYYVSIYNNSPGCSSAEEIEQLCLAQVSKDYTEPVFRIYPNPSKDILNISNTDDIRIDNIFIYNSFGQVVHNQVLIDNKIDISNSKCFSIVQLLKTRTTHFNLKKMT